jgi:predicted RNA binding protein YcfA (HicA-like mRNA interferase family)
MPRLPVVSGIKFAKMLQRIGYSCVRQRGSHMIYRSGSKHISVPRHRELDAGLLHGMLRTVSRQTGLSIDELIKMLSE